MKLKLFLLFIIYNLSFYIVATATIRYVSKTATSTPPYTSWATASDSIQKCINICQNGDTVYVANGIYKETIIVNREIALIGSSMDSTVINAIGLASNKVIEFRTHATIKYLNVIGRNKNEANTYCLFNLVSNVNVEYCRLSNAFNTCALSGSSIVKNALIYNANTAFRSECPADTCHPELSNSVIYSTGNFSTIYLSFGGNPLITNNIIIDGEGVGIDSDYNKNLLISNNIVAGFKRQNIDVGSLRDSAILLNNNALYLKGEGTSIAINQGQKTKLRNNIIAYSDKGVGAGGTSLNSNYNLFWVNSINVANIATLGDSDIIADPMFVKDTVPNHAMNFDYHLQKYSPAIDKGDPNILDKDGTRSDNGVYGGPFGEIYTYQDLAPRPPRNLSALLDTFSIRVKWNKNTEADTSYYKVYRDTVINFAIDSTKLVSSQADTNYNQSIPHKIRKYVYKVTCVDNQGNESKPSEEIVVNITSINDYPMTINDYFLYQNYPNPFNPSTTIGYKLKERGYVKLMVYDIKGEMLSVLVNQEQEAGYYEVEFATSVGSLQSTVSNKNNIASGIYLYRIEVIGERNIPVYMEMKKMLLVK